MNKEIPVYMVLGFLDSGKTTFIQETLQNPESKKDGKYLILLTEEGEVELDTAKFAGKKNVIEIIDDKEQLTTEYLTELTNKHNPDRIIIEYNGMWLLQELFNVIPDGWAPCQFITFLDSSSILNYNKNMRQLVYDKLQLADLVVFNRFNFDIDVMPFHKLVKQATRRAQIIYEDASGKMMQDTIEDPLPYDLNKPVVTIEDRDYAYYYADINENPKNYKGKTVEFLGVVSVEKMPSGYFAIGRPVMNCCAEDVQYASLLCRAKSTESLKTGQWIRLKAKIAVEYSRFYQGTGPIYDLIDFQPAAEPEDPVATFY